MFVTGVQTCALPIYTVTSIIEIKQGLQSLTVSPVLPLLRREKYAMMFDEPVLLQLGWWYVAWARVSGPSSDCGSHGQATITTDDR